MLLSLNCCVVVLLGLFAATACAAPDSANQQAERLHVKRLMNGFVAITAEQNVRQFISGIVMLCSFVYISDAFSSSFSLRSSCLTPGNGPHFSINSLAHSRRSIFAECADAYVVLIQQRRY